eukprot:g20754.t1
MSTFTVAEIDAQLQIAREKRGNLQRKLKLTKTSIETLSAARTEAKRWEKLNPAVLGPGHQWVQVPVQQVHVPVQPINHAGSGIQEDTDE